MKTTSGFEFEINKSALTDWRLLDAFMTLDDKSASDISRSNAVRKALNMLIGEDQKDMLYKHIADKHDGAVESTDLIAEFNEIVAQAQGDKKK